MREPLTSVIIPCYNVEKYLEDAVESVVCQTYHNIEIILVDDGSTDGTSALCDMFANKYNNIHVIHKDNGGLSSARNAGMAEATGEYIYFLDSDDYIKEVMIDRLVKKMEESELDVIYFGSCNVDEGGNTIDVPRREIADENKVYYGIEAYELFFKEGIYEACVQYYFYKRAFLNSSMLSFADKIIHEDELFSFEVYHYAKKMMLDSNQYYFKRVRNGSIMTSFSNQEQKFESTVRITDMVTNRSYLKQFSADEDKNILLFLHRIQDLMCSRFYEVSWQQKKMWGKKYRKSLGKYIAFAIAHRQLANVQTSLMRYVLSLYATQCNKEEAV